jgi:hypothetical protein
MKQMFFVFLFFKSSMWGLFTEIESAQDLQKKILSSKEYIIAIGMWPCIPCEKIKKRLMKDQKILPDIYWIDVRKHPNIRHVFNFKAVPYLAVYKEGELLVNLTGEKAAKDYLISIQY